MISSCYAIAFFCLLHSVPMPYTLTRSIFRRFSLRLCIHTAFLRPPFMFFVCAGVGESKSLTARFSHCCFCARLDGILSRFVVTSADLLVRVPLLLINDYLVDACASYCSSCVGRRRILHPSDLVWVRRCRLYHSAIIARAVNCYFRPVIRACCRCHISSSRASSSLIVYVGVYVLPAMLSSWLSGAHRPSGRDKVALATATEIYAVCCIRSSCVCVLRTVSDVNCLAALPISRVVV